MIIGFTIGLPVVLFIGVCCFLCGAKHKATPSKVAGVGILMTGTTSASHTTQPGEIQLPPPNPFQQPAENPCPPPPMDYVPAPTNPSSPPPPYPYPSDPPPPYPGKETVLQYPSPGQPYPWLQPQCSSISTA